MKTIKLNNQEIEFIKIAIDNNDKVYNQNEYDYIDFENKFGIDMDDVDYMLSDLSDKLDNQFGGLNLTQNEIEFIKLSIVMIENSSNELSFEEFENTFGINMDELDNVTFHLSEKINN